MKGFVTTFGLAIGLLGWLSPMAIAQDASSNERAAARRDLEIAKLELRHYLQVEYPRQKRHLDAQIQLTEAEVRALRDRLREYRPFDRFSTGGALFVTIQDARMCLLDAELRLDDLRAERNHLIRFHSDQWRLLEIRAYEARARVAELERGDEILPPPAAANGTP
jgi:hypothetical protein